MERPSHSTFPSAHPFSNRLVSTGLAISVPLAIALVLSHGLVAHFIPHTEVTFGRVIEDPKKLPVTPPPPPPKMERLAIIDLVPPQFTTDNTGANDHGGGLSTGSRTIDLVPPLNPATGPTRALSGIAASHSQPPYPVIEERLGEEGTVSLRLTVTADGHVAKADIVRSSGHPRLDEAAQTWIVAHWLYRPALDQGQPVASQVTANVIFNLKS